MMDGRGREQESVVGVDRSVEGKHRLFIVGTFLFEIRRGWIVRGGAADGGLGQRVWIGWCWIRL